MLNKVRYFIAALLIIISVKVNAQHNGHEHNDHGNTDTMKTETDTLKPMEHEHNENMDSTHKHIEPRDTVQKHNEHNEHKEHSTELSIDGEHNMNMSHIYSLNLPMTRNASGTSWLPDASPMFGYMAHSGGWMFMLHGNLFLRYNSQDVFKEGSRGRSMFDAPNWFMAMGQHKIGSSGLFGFSAMLSLDPLTVGGRGYPLLFQTGETYDGEALVDRQHPHNFFSELAVGYSHAFSKKVDANLYLGYPGEPALGPVAFMHRISALYNPDSPLGHHWQDATHITFGVATLGIRYDMFKLEGSLFTGREPGEDRYTFEKPTFDSYSFRLASNPSPEFALQVSHAFIKSPEALHPDDVRRTTASVIHTKQLRGYNNFISSALVWGMNDAGGHHKENSVLLESALNLYKNAVYGRFEWVQKSREELNLPQPMFDDPDLMSISALTLGVSRRIFNFSKTSVSFGLQATRFFPGKELQPIYGKNPISAEVYLRITPGLMH